MHPLSGKPIAERIFAQLQSRPVPKKFLGAIVVGDDSDSAGFVATKKRTARRLGVDFRVYQIPQTTTNDQLRKKVGEIAGHTSCGGLLVQLPLPDQLNKHYICNRIPPEKDVDVLGERALGAFYAGRSAVLPPAVATTKTIVQETGIELARSCVAVVGSGFLIGRPIATWLMDQAREVIVVGRESDAGALLAQADLVICAAGAAGAVKKEFLKKGANVIDFGYSRAADGTLMGDFAAGRDNIDEKEDGAFYTPTPGGTGPILVAQLIENFYTLCADV